MSSTKSGIPGFNTAAMTRTQGTRSHARLEAETKALVSGRETSPCVLEAPTRLTSFPPSAPETDSPGFLYGLLTELPVVECLHYGNAAAAVVVS